MSTKIDAEPIYTRFPNDSEAQLCADVNAIIENDRLNIDLKDNKQMQQAIDAVGMKRRVESPLRGDRGILRYA